MELVLVIAGICIYVAGYKHGLSKKSVVFENHTGQSVEMDVDLNDYKKNIIITIKKIEDLNQK